MAVPRPVAVAIDCESLSTARDLRNLSGAG